MCYSAEISILSFFVGLAGSITCIALGSIDDKIIGYFIAFVACMQGIEYLLWNHQTCDQYNIFLSHIAMSLNHLQPIVLGCLILVFNTKVKNPNTIVLHMFLYMCSVLPYSLQFLDQTQNQCTIKGEENSHLLWNWNRMKYSTLMYAIFLGTVCALFYYGLSKTNFAIFAIDVAILSYATTAIIYQSKYIGSLWCFYTMFIPILYITYRLQTM